MDLKTIASALENAIEAIAENETDIQANMGETH